MLRPIQYEAVATGASHRRMRRRIVRQSAGVDLFRFIMMSCLRTVGTSRLPDPELRGPARGPSEGFSM